MKIWKHHAERQPLRSAQDDQTKMPALLRFVFQIALILAAAAIVESSAYAAQAEEIPDDGRVSLYRGARPRDGGKLFFLWKQIEGPSVTIADPTASRVEKDAEGKEKWISETYFVPKEPGKYRFELSVKNEEGIESKVIVEREVLAPSPPPVAVAGADQNKTVGEMVRLNGLNSKSADGKAIAQWEWRIVQSPPKFQPDAKLLKERAWDFKAEEAGAYQFELRVNDGKRWSEPSRMVVAIKPVSLPPMIDEEDPGIKKVELQPGPPVVTPPKRVVKAIAASGREIKLGEALSLDGSASSVSEDDKPEFYWKQTSGPLVRQLAPNQTRPFSEKRSDTNNYPVWNCTPAQAGEYTFVLKITLPDAPKGDAEFESEPVVYKVADTNATTATEVKPPPAVDVVLISAHISADKVQADAGDTVRLDGSKSKGPDGSALKYVWAPVEGKRYPKSWSGVDGPQVEFTADEEGEYAISLIVSDGKNQSPPDQIVITVGPRNLPPAVKLDAAYETVLIPDIEEAKKNPLQIKAAVTDPENDKFDVLWSCIDSPTKPALKIPKEFATFQTLAFVPRSKGVYVFRITATDAKGHSAHADTTVTVKGMAEQSPTAKIDGPKSATLGKKVTLDGSRSSNPQKGTLTYYWKQEEGPTIPGDAPGRKQKYWDFTTKEPGKYVISLEVSDGPNKSQTDKFELVVAKEIHPPIATIKHPGKEKIGEGEEIIFDGAESTQTDGDKLAYKWTKLDGTAELKLDGNDQPQLHVTGVSGGTARIQLMVSDGTSESAPAIVQLVVDKAHAKPTAHISGPATAKADTVVVLSGAESTGEGEIVSYVWSQPTDGGPKTGLSRRDLRKKEITFKPEQAGTYVFDLIVVDKDGTKSEPATHSVEVKGIVRPPHAIAELLDKNEPATVGKEVKLSARGSVDPQGGALTYKWKQKSGTPVELPADAGEVITIVPPEPGSYVFELTVVAGENESQPQEVSFVVQAPNRPPVAAIAEIASCEPGEKIILDGSGSSDPDGDKLEYRWSKVSGPDVNFGHRGDHVPKTEVSLQKEGEYVFELKVFDGKVWSEPARAAVKTRAANVPPIAAFAQPQIRTEENMETILDASASTDPDNGPRPLTFTWRQKDGPKVELHTDDSAFAKFTPVRTGQMSFEVVANDGKANSPPAVVRVEVLKSGTLPVAVPNSKPPSPAKVSHRETRDNVLILDGTQSKPRNKPLTYQWKQIGGDDLHLPPDRLNKDRVGLLVFVAGAYKFSLIVSDGQNTSQPAIVEVNVVDDGAAQPPPADSKKTEGTPEKTQIQVPEGPHKDGALLPPPKDAKSIEVTSASDDIKENENAALKNSLEELAKKPGADAEKTLITALSNSDKEVRALAAEALYSRGVNSIPALIGALDSADPLAKSEAYWALKELTHETFGSESEKWKDWWAAQPEAAKTSRE